MVTIPFRDKPLPPDSADRAGADLAVCQEAGSAVAGAVVEAGAEGADAAHKAGHKELMRCGARSA